MTDFPQLEKYYEVQLFAMVLKEDGTAKTLFLSQSSFPTKIYLNVFKNHLSLITDIKMYSKQYICNRCEKVFSKMQKLKQHEPRCDGTVEYAFPGGVYKNKLSIFEELEEMGVLTLKLISGIFVKVWIRLKKLNARKERHGIRYIYQCLLVWGVIWKG